MSFEKGMGPAPSGVGSPVLFRFISKAIHAGPPCPFSSDCTPGYLLPPTRSPAAVALPSLRVTLAAGACAAALDRPNATAPLPVVTCTPLAVAFDYQGASVLPARTTPGAAVGPACGVSAALSVAGVNATGVTKVIIPPVTLRCSSLDALRRGECELGGGVSARKKVRGRKGGLTLAAPDVDSVLNEVDAFVRDVLWV